MVEESVEDSSPDLSANSQQPTADVEQPTPISDNSVPVLSVIAPSSVPDVVTSVKTDEGFLGWVFDSTFTFLNLADLDRMMTVDALRKVKEPEIRDKISVANSALVLLAHYGSNTDNEDLVKACELYATKMKTIIQRLCL